jgi:2-keto-4-pentenoate hydratase/2-oxohepta-3-ene-1,7-dioic acid hydratase in catechol pathway
VRIVRFAAGDEVSYGLVGTAKEGRGAPGGQVIAELAGHPFGGGRDSIQLTGTTYPLADVRLLAPVLPSKVVGFGTAGTAGGTDDGPADGYVLYLRPSTAVSGPGDPIRYPGELTRSVVAAGQLAVVIGRLSRRVPPSQAAAVVFGYTCATDVTARDLAERDGQWARAKGFDTFCPLGPWIETGPVAGEAALTTAVNGEVRLRTSLPRDGVPELVAYASSVMTLLPGDVLLTGTSAEAGGWGGVAGPEPAEGGVAGSEPAEGGVAGPELAGWPVEPGDEVSVTIEGIGTLTNKVEKGD